MVNVNMKIPKDKNGGVKKQEEKVKEEKVKDRKDKEEEEEENKEKINLINLSGLYEALKIRLDHLIHFKNDTGKRLEKEKGLQSWELTRGSFKSGLGLGPLLKLSVKDNLIKNGNSNSTHFQKSKEAGNRKKITSRGGFQ